MTAPGDGGRGKGTFAPPREELDKQVDLLSRSDEIMDVQSGEVQRWPGARPGVGGSPSPGAYPEPDQEEGTPALVDTRMAEATLEDAAPLERGLLAGGRGLLLLASACALVATLVFFMGAFQAARLRYKGQGIGGGPAGGAGAQEGGAARLEKDMAFIIYSKPDKAEVVIDDISRGRTPAATNVSCLEGDQVNVVVSAPQRQPYGRSFTCRAGSVRLNIKLEK